ncbi:MAG: hypothetical protein PVF49_08335 [Anaerolineales bacterium]|jgi:hypothetical protein
MKYQKVTRTVPSTLLVLLIIISCFAAPAALRADENSFHVGGALRYNYRYMDWKDESYARVNKDQGGEFLLDTYRINVDGTYKGIDLSLEYRFYSGYNMLHHGYFGYAFDDLNQIQLGVSQKPFGIQPYASHNWFFSIAYYIGLEDNYDAGLKYIHTDGPWSFKLAFYKNSGGNYTGTSDVSSRYSYDIVPEKSAISWITGQVSNNREDNQFNGRVAYTMTHDETSKTELGISGEFGMLYNGALAQLNDMDPADAAALYTGNTDPWGNHWAIGGHVNGTYGSFNLMAFVIYTQADPKTLNEENLTAAGFAAGYQPDFGDSLVVYGAYDFPYTVASKGWVLAFEPAYTVPVKWGPVTSLQFYNDFSVYLKSDDRFAAQTDVKPTFHNITGVLVTAGKVYTYVDIAQGKNNPWLGNYTNGLAAGNPDAEWKMRFNINFGYYF